MPHGALVLPMRTAARGQRGLIVSTEGLRSSDERQQESEQQHQSAGSSPCSPSELCYRSQHLRRLRLFHWIPRRNPAEAIVDSHTYRPMHFIDARVDILADHLEPDTRELCRTLSSDQPGLVGELEGEAWRAALLTGAITRDATLRFRLRNHCGLAGQSNKHHLPRRNAKRVRLMTERQRTGTIRALLSGSGELWLTTHKRVAFHHAHHAVMLTVLAAASRQIRLALWCHRKERRSERKAKDGQQRDGDQLTQCLH